MGFNTTVVVMNDALHIIRDDPNFGKNLYDAIISRSVSEGKRVDVPAYGHEGRSVHCNAATVIECHHADATAVVAVGGNYGTKLGTVWTYKHHEQEDKVQIIKQLYDEYVLRPKREAKKLKAKEKA